jgi:hypothetical protein
MSLDYLRYEVKLYELENRRWNYYVFVSTRAGERWSQSIKVGDGSEDTETQAIDAAQEKATADRSTREQERSHMKTVPLA